MYIYTPLENIWTYHIEYYSDYIIIIHLFPHIQPTTTTGKMCYNMRKDGFDCFLPTQNNASNTKQSTFNGKTMMMEMMIVLSEWIHVCEFLCVCC